MVNPVRDAKLRETLIINRFGNDENDFNLGYGHQIYLFIIQILCTRIVSFGCRINNRQIIFRIF